MRAFDWSPGFRRTILPQVFVDFSTASAQSNAANLRAFVYNLRLPAMSTALIAAVARSGRILANACGPRSAAFGHVMQVRMASGATPVSRKVLKRMNAAYDNSGTADAPDFHRLVTEFFDQVERAVEGMKQKNAGFTVTRGEKKLDIDLGDGKVRAFHEFVWCLLLLCLLLGEVDIIDEVAAAVVGLCFREHTCSRQMMK